MKNLFIFLIALYQKFISPFFPPVCRFQPTCSEYAKQSLGKYGLIKGVFWAIKRILRCHPFSNGGYDPVK